MDDDTNSDNTSAEDILEKTRGDNVIPIVKKDDDPTLPVEDSVEDVLPPDHPSNDSDVDETERYNEA